MSPEDETDLLRRLHKVERRVYVAMRDINVIAAAFLGWLAYASMSGWSEGWRIAGAIAAFCIAGYYFDRKLDKE
jgi:uncharacterized membrane protein